MSKESASQQSVEIWGFQGGEYWGYSLLGYNSMQCGRQPQTF